MKLIDFDGMFDEKLTQYMEENKGKYTEKQWENLIPKLYKKFGDTVVGKIKCTPKEYYARMDDNELISTFENHLSSDVPVPEFLCAEIEKRNPVDALIPLLKSENGETVSYAINLIGDDARAFNEYFSIIVEEKFDVDIRDAAAQQLKDNADAAKETALAFLDMGLQTEYMLEILSRVKIRDERVYALLVDAFKSNENLAMRASYLAAYGDERALQLLLDRIEDESLCYVDFQELKYAIEALGGEYNKPRDFSSDKDFITIEEASIKEGFDPNSFKQ